MTVRQVADKLASFVAKNGRQFENITRQRNPGDTPFKFLFDKNCPDYKYYEFQLAEEERALAQSKEAEASKANSGTASFKAPGGTYRSSFEQKSNYQTPASALYGAYEGSSSQGSSSSYGDHTAPPSDPVALMEFYAKKAALEERKRPPRQSKDEMPPPPSLQAQLIPVQVLLRRDTTWVISFLKKNLKSLWHGVMMLQHKRLPKKPLRRLRFRRTILGTNFYLRWVGGKVRVLGAREEAVQIPLWLEM
ncbi:SURP and G-patch domain-containing protein 1-like protein [Zea mays]|uniref:SURP and G-patch domain-containing protein 1-like protein n=1 Tax=Zea mays TaxID=4577 RepID=A0A1D6IHL3_MAIZE|nr:SURP and G-patch domain-containing protein 1-like protein [Zea mays]